MLPQDILQRLRVEQRVLGYLIDDIREVCEEIPLVPIRQDGRHARVVELDFVVVHLDEVDGGVDGHERAERCVDNLADGALGGEVSMAVQARCCAGRW